MRRPTPPFPRTRTPQSPRRSRPLRAHRSAAPTPAGDRCGMAARAPSRAFRIRPAPPWKPCRSRGPSGPAASPTREALRRDPARSPRGNRQEPSRPFSFLTAPLYKYARFGCVASEGGAPFVARRAMNLHGCAPASLCPPFSLLRGYPRERISYGSGAPPLLRRLAGPSRSVRLPCCFPYTLPYLLRSLCQQVFDEPGSRRDELPGIAPFRFRVSPLRGRGQSRGRRVEDERDRLLRVRPDGDGSRMVRQEENPEVPLLPHSREKRGQHLPIDPFDRADLLRDAPV